MSRTQRLFDLIQLLRRYRYPVSGKRLAETLSISLRTLYRDIATLQAQGASIDGEPGVGYILRLQAKCLLAILLWLLIQMVTGYESLLLGSHDNAY